jgi:pimeloyl-ACP methyl ester carboxylesterase
MKKIKNLFLAITLVALVALAGVYIFYTVVQEPRVMDETARKETSGKFIQLSKGITRYQLEGPDTAQTVILLHGGSVVGYYVWERNYQALVDAGFRVLRYDMYGRGYSDRLNETQSLDLLVSQLNELTDSLKLSTPFDIVGVSMGGTVATGFADRYPEKTGKITLISPIAINPMRKKWFIENPVLGDYLISVYWYPRCVQKQMKDFYDGKKLVEFESRLTHLSQFKGLKTDTRSAWLNILTEDLSLAVERLGQRNKEVLLIWGIQDPVVPMAASEKYKRLLPSVKLVGIDQAGHLSNYEKPDEVNAEIIRFLRN